MRSRAGILPYVGDPFLLNYWLKFYDKVWGSEVDKLYIYAHNLIGEEIWDYIRRRCVKSKNVFLIEDHNQLEHGDSIDKALNSVTEEYVVLLEDDCFIFKSGKIDKCFQEIENEHLSLIGSKRGSCSKEILDRAAEIWGLSYEGLGDQGCNFWPNLLFTHKKILRATSRKFGATHWNPGDYCRPLDYNFNEEAVGDTFVFASLELRRMLPKGQIGYIPQYHASPDDLRDYEYKRLLFDGDAPWTHMGSLSSGVGGIIRDKFNRPLSTGESMLKEENATLPNEWCKTDMEKQEFERRVCSWDMAWQERETNELLEFGQEYKDGLERIITQYGLNRGAIRRRQNVYRELGL